jgi:hypothetical protein
MPGETGVTVVTTLVCFFTFCTRGCGRIERPAFPAPSDLQKAKAICITRTHRAARSRNCILKRGEVADSVVMPGLDPGIHPSSQNAFTKKMDHRVKPGDDELKSPPDAVVV